MYGQKSEKAIISVRSLSFFFNELLLKVLAYL